MTETSDAELALAGFARDLVLELAAAEAVSMAAGLPKPARGRVMGPHEHEVARQANPDYARLRGIPPLDPSAEKWCSYCGNSKESELVPGPDHEYGFSDWMCKDSLDRHCQARHERRWPAMPEKAEPVLMKLARMQDDAAAASRLARSAPQEPPERQQEPARQETAPGAWDTTGGWHPAANPFYAAGWAASPWGHTLRHHANRSHLLGNDPFMAQAYGRAAGPGRDAAAGAHWGAETAREPSGGQIPPEGLPEGVRQAIHGDAPGSDVQMQQPQHPDGLPARPGQPQPARPRRRRRLRYTAARRKPAQHPPAHRPPPDSGWGSAGEGPSGGSESAGLAHAGTSD